MLTVIIFLYDRLICLLKWQIKEVSVKLTRKKKLTILTRKLNKTSKSLILILVLTACQDFSCYDQAFGLESNLNEAIQPGKNILHSLISNNQIKTGSVAKSSPKSVNKPKKTAKINKQSSSYDETTQLVDELNFRDTDYAKLREQIKQELNETYKPSSIFSGTVMPSMLRQPAQNSKIFLPDTCVAGSFATMTIFDSLGDRQSYVGVKINDTDLQSDYSGQVVFLVPQNDAKELDITLLNSNFQSVAKLIQGPAYVSSVDHPTAKIETAAITHDLFDILTLKGSNFDGIANNNHAYIDDVEPVQILAASPCELKLRLPKTLDAGAHYIHLVTDGVKSNQLPFNYTLK